MSTETSPQGFSRRFARISDSPSLCPPPGTERSLAACSSTAAAALLLHWLRGGPPAVTVVVTDSSRSLDALYQDVHTLSEGDLSGTAYFPGWETVADSDLHGVAPEIAGDRLQTLLRLRRRPDALCVFTHVQSLLQPVPDPEHLSGRVLHIAPGDSHPMEPFCETLLELGYVFEAEVTDKGEAARRGGVLDLWPPDQPHPLRLDYFGDTLEAMRQFDPATQRSLETVKELDLLPAREQSRETSASLFNYLPEHTRWLWLDFPSIAEHGQLYQESQDSPFLLWAQVEAELRAVGGGGVLYTGDGLPQDPLPLQLSACPGISSPVASGDVSARVEAERLALIRENRALADSGWTVVFCLNTEGSLARFLEAYSVELEGADCMYCHQGMIAEGFRFPELQLSVIGEQDLYGIRKPVRNKYDPHAATRRHPQGMGSRIEGWTELEPGDWVVHVDHGIGKYLGLYEIDMAGTTQEVLTLEYAGGAKLHVPVSQAHLLSRYMGVGGSTPDPHALGGSQWQRQKITAEKAVRDLASQLLQTQALREAHPGHGFSADSAWQAEFEATFPFTETADQEAAIRATKEDMERTRPMDRLICGDVGYGKTEVAMRAAFKAVMDGKQVAMLVPTTVLALQHFQSFRERMAAFPLSIDMLSRLRSPAEQREILGRLRAGKLDIVIGTHRLVSKDVVFADLGLVIIDEEQRFGVRHKERLKEMKGLVDVLTLSATPIPRTLYLSLTGARDVSSIQTAPRERLPIRTEVGELDDELIRKTILRELNRGGQIFFLHNRVLTLENMRQRLSACVPEARILVAHGQMAERQLERVMREFSEGNADLLLCTTIIESGVDMPNVNTIIIDRADRFGLAELYQLRGRVGRYKHQAYCLLLLPAKGESRAVARERIRVIRKYSALGSGLKIALRDLEIRGAGNLLGPQQSGHIASVGFELYCQLLEQSIRQLKKLPPQRIVDVRVSIDFLELRPETGDHPSACFLPVSYVEDEALRVELYRRIAGLATPEAVNELEEELADRFGRMPQAAKNLFRLARIRIAATRIKVQVLEVRENKIRMTRSGNYLMQNGKFPRLYRATPRDKLEELMRVLEGWADHA